MKSKTKVLIIGAGLSGLSAAYHLRKKYKVRIIEKEGEAGGLATTEKVRGFRFDRMGHLLHLKNPYVKNLILHKLFDGKLKKIKRDSRVWFEGVYTRYPFQSNTFGLPKKIADECLREYLKVKFNPPSKKIRTFEDFIYYYFGKGFAKHFMIPYNRKIWGVHPREMSVEWCKRFVPIPKLEEVIEGAMKNNSKELGYNVNFYYPSKGIEELPRKLVSLLSQDNISVEFGKAARSIDFKKKEVCFSDGERVKYDVLISTMPLKELLNHLVSPPSSIIKTKDMLRCKSLFYLDIAIKRPSLKSFHWCYVPEPHIPFYRVYINSNASRGCAPKGRSSLCVEMSGHKFNNSIIPQVLKYLKEMGIIKRETDVLFVLPKYIKYAYVIYDHNYSKIVPAIHKFLNKQDIYSIGRYGNWDYSCMEDALLMGKNVGGFI